MSETRPIVVTACTHKVLPDKIIDLIVVNIYLKKRFLCVYWKI